MASQATAAAVPVGPNSGGDDFDDFVSRVAASNARPPKRQAQGSRGPNKQAKKAKQQKVKPTKEGSNEEVLALDIQALLAGLELSDGPEKPQAAEGEPARPLPPLPEEGTEFDVKVMELSSTGEGLALQEGCPRRHVYVVPFAFPGDTVRIKVHRHGRGDQRHSLADFVSVVEPSPARDDARVRCQYYSRCGGCNFQPLSYEDQLAHKRRVVEKAFANFSDMPPELLPPVGETVGSPLQYGYRTKLTPHFDGPVGRKKQNQVRTEMPDIGFLLKGRRRTLDVEDCPIGTDAVRQGMARERARMAVEYTKYTKGATILLRESTKRYPKMATTTGEGEAASTAGPPVELPPYAVKVETDRYVDVKTCVSDPKAISTEYVDDFVFENEANSFFQNNNSILPVFTQYVRDNILPRAATEGEDGKGSAPPVIRNLIDAYSGSGLFTIALSPIFGRESRTSLGIDIDTKAVAKARDNARLNGILDKCNFIAADATRLFHGAPLDLDPDETAVVLDPPRKGCDASFLRQLLAFGPRRVLYVSCNVHTQARDVGVLSRGHVEGEARPEGGPRYEVESIRGFDFFPQTSHVEGVAVLNRVGDAPQRPVDAARAASPVRSRSRSRSPFHAARARSRSPRVDRARSASPKASF